MAYEHLVLIHGWEMSSCMQVASKVTTYQDRFAKNRLTWGNPSLMQGGGLVPRRDYRARLHRAPE